jgi:hypothetical protein
VPDERAISSAGSAPLAERSVLQDRAGLRCVPAAPSVGLKSRERLSSSSAVRFHVMGPGFDATER